VNPRRCWTAKSYTLLWLVAKLWPEKTETVRYDGPTICNETGNGPNSSLAATSLIVID
jgi:hypothetical protein